MYKNYRLIDQSFASDIPQEFNVITTMSEAELLPKDRFELLDALDYCSRLEDNWNGYDAKKPTNFVIESVKKFIQSLPFNKYMPNELSPDGEGGITLKWLKPGESLLLNFEPGLIHMAFEKNNHDSIFIDNITYLAESSIIPQKIISCIPIRH